jgi:hydrogenase maturation protein HypF
MTSHKIGQKIRVSGIVQGVGFRPFIYAQATQNNLTGWVRNTSSGVEIEINGSQKDVEAFLLALRTNPPSLARIDSLTSVSCPVDSFKSFEIIVSQPQEGDFLTI